MNLRDITRILDNVGLAPIGRDSLMRLAGTPDGKRFQSALLAVDAGDVDQRFELVRIIELLNASGTSTTPVAAVPVRQRNTNAPGTAEQQGKSKAPPPYDNFHIYSSAAALCISEATVRSTGASTIQIEAANVLGGGQRRSFDWSNKITIQLSEQEMMLTLALFMGKIQAISIAGHGDQRDKFLRLERQPHAWFAEVGQRGRPLRSAPISAPDASRITALAFRQVIANSPHLDAGIIHVLLDQVAAMHKEPDMARVGHQRQQP